MQLAQFRARARSQSSIDQDVAQLAVGAQRVGLPAGPVEGEYPMRPEPFTQRMGGGERIQLRDEVAVPAARQQRLAP